MVIRAVPFLLALATACASQEAENRTTAPKPSPVQDNSYRQFQCEESGGTWVDRGGYSVCEREPGLLNKNEEDVYTQPGDTTTEAEEADSSVISYIIKGPSSASITYTNKNGGTSQATDASLPWVKEFKVPIYVQNFFLYVSAQDMTGTSGKITCTIKVDGTVWEKGASSGPYSICEASGTW